MKLFTCSACQQIVYFENSQCTRCGHALAFLPEIAQITALEPAEGAPEGTYIALAPELKKGRVRLCGNQLDHGACNWALPEADTHRFCRACRLNEMIPNLSEPGAKEAWINMENAKRRLVYQLLALGLPVEPRNEQPRGLAFAFKKDVPGGEKVLIGQEGGLVTINIAEADSPFREKTRLSLGERYRTLLGHFRHEIGHYYCERIVLSTPFAEPFRALFGDERASYDEALDRHYKNGAPADWPTKYVSAYATMHPHEDWAETWAHYLHMVDTLETARSCGVTIRSHVAKADENLAVATKRLDFDDFDELIEAWAPLTVVVNNLNRSMGLVDVYPFALPELAVKKLRFVHEVVQKSGVASAYNKAA
jgi:hypothetical protein